MLILLYFTHGTITAAFFLSQPYHVLKNTDYFVLRTVE
jgi:hypothetical protein